MIFLTTGSELPFNRLVRAVDRWCENTGRTDVYGQLGVVGPDDYTPRNFEWSGFLDPQDYQRRFDEAEAVVAHAGMGSIISALMTAKPILIMPRRADHHETRNDHQVATVERFSVRPCVFGAQTEDEVIEAMETMLSSLKTVSAVPVSDFAGEELIACLREFIAQR